MKTLIRTLPFLLVCCHVSYGQSLKNQISSYNNGVNSSITNSNTHSQQITQTIVGNAFTNLSGIMNNMYDSLHTDSVVLSGDVTGSGTNSIGTTIGNNKVTYAKIQTETANTLLGNPTGSTVNTSAITLGSGLAFSGSILTSTTPTPFSFNSVKSAGTDNFIFKGADTGSYQNARELGNIIYDTTNHRWVASYSAFTLPVPPAAGDTIEHTHFIASQDLIHWYGLGYCPWPSEDGYLLKMNGTYYLYFEDKRAVPFRNIRLETTTDTSFNTWTDKGTVFDVDSTNANCWECKDVSSPVVFTDNDTIKLLYEGRGTNNGGATGLAWSLDGLYFYRYSNVPVIGHASLAPVTFPWASENIPDEIIKRPDGWYLSSHCFGVINKFTGAQDFRTGISYSPDLHNWRNYLGAPMQITDGNSELGEGLMLYYNNNELYGMYVDSAYKSLYGGKLIVVPDKITDSGAYKAISMDINHTYAETQYLSDMNNLTNGSYNGYAGSGATDKPVNTNSHFISIVLDTNHIAQLAFPNLVSTSVSDRPFYRNKQTTWSNWMQLLTDVDTLSNSSTGIKLATQNYVALHAGTGTVTSITPLWGFTNNTPITTSGSLVIDTTKVCSIYALGDSSLIWHTALLDSALALRAMTTSLTGDVTGSGNGSFATTISSHAVTYAKMQTVSANKLLGNPTGSTANVSEIGLGSNMTIFSGNLTKYIPSTNVNSDYTATNSDELILAEPTGSNITITLPTTGIVAGKSFIIKGINTSPTQTVTVTSPTSIDGNVSDTVLTTDNQAICYVFDGTKYWIVSSYNPLPPIYGSSTQSGDGTTTAFTIAHGLGATPTWYNVVPTSSAAANIAYITADATNITVHYTVAPALGTNNLTYNFQAKQ